MRVLCFTPTRGQQMRPETAASVAAQVFDGEVVHEVSRRNPFPGRDLRNIVAQYTRAWERALAGGYDALWTVEHDMDVPPDALARLVATGAQVAYGVYLLRHGVHVVNAWQYVGDRNLGESLSLKPKLFRQALEKKVVRVCGVGNGCTLIRRGVLERIPVRSGDNHAPDIPFARDCLRAGIELVADFGVLCGHWDGEKWLRVGGPAGPGAMMQVVVVQDVVASVDGESRRLRRGERHELPWGVAADLSRAGFVTAG